MSSVPTITYVLDGLGAFGIIVGGYVATKSVYFRENSKDAAMLIDTQRKRIDSLVEELKEAREDRTKVHAQLNDMQGQLKVYKELQVVSPDTVVKLLDTQNMILDTLKSSALTLVQDTKDAATAVKKVKSDLAGQDENS